MDEGETLVVAIRKLTNRELGELLEQTSMIMMSGDEGLAIAALLAVAGKRLKGERE